MLSSVVIFLVIVAIIGLLFCALYGAQVILGLICTVLSLAGVALGVGLLVKIGGPIGAVGIFIILFSSVWVWMGILMTKEGIEEIARRW